MNLLLDTHIWLWSLLEPNRLSSKVSRLLDDNASVIWLSPISTWEAVLLIQKGRITVDKDAEAWVADALSVAKFREAPLTNEIVLATVSLQLPHRDPADRFLGATAKVLGLTLITADRHLAKSRDFAVLVNR